VCYAECPEAEKDYSKGICFSLIPESSLYKLCNIQTQRTHEANSTYTADESVLVISLCYSPQKGALTIVKGD